jgi:hypothetical protein
MEFFSILFYFLKFHFFFKISFWRQNSHFLYPKTRFFIKNKLLKLVVLRPLFLYYLSLFYIKCPKSARIFNFFPYFGGCFCLYVYSICSIILKNIIGISYFTGFFGNFPMLSCNSFFYCPRIFMGKIRIVGVNY